MEYVYRPICEEELRPTDDIRKYRSLINLTIAQIRNPDLIPIEKLDTEESIKRQIKRDAEHILTEQIDNNKYKLDIEYKEPLEKIEQDGLCDICMSKIGCEGLKCGTCKNNNICIDCFNSLPERSCDVYMLNFEDSKKYKIGEWDDFKYLYELEKQRYDNKNRISSYRQYYYNKEYKNQLPYTILHNNRTLEHQNKIINLDNKLSQQNKLTRTYDYSFKCPFCRSITSLNVSKMSKDDIIYMTWNDLAKLKMKQFQVHNNDCATRYEVLRDLEKSIPLCKTNELKDKVNKLLDCDLFKKNSTSDYEKNILIKENTIEEQKNIIKELQDENNKIKDEYNAYVNDINSKLPNFNNCINALSFMVEYNKSIIYKIKKVIDNNKGRPLKKELNKILSSIDNIKIEATRVSQEDGSICKMEITNI